MNHTLTNYNHNYLNFIVFILPISILVIIPICLQKIPLLYKFYKYVKNKCINNNLNFNNNLNSNLNILPSYIQEVREIKENSISSNDSEDLPAYNEILN